jgi:hypothetical protein
MITFPCGASERTSKQDIGIPEIRTRKCLLGKKIRNQFT